MQKLLVTDLSSTMESSSLAAISHSSPSFNGYSSGRLAEIAARVVREFRDESADSNIGEDADDGIFYFNNDDEEEKEEEGDEPVVKKDGDDDDEFEFAVVCRDQPEYFSPISADEIFYNGQIRPVYPLFDRSLLLTANDSDNYSSISTAITTRSDQKSSDSKPPAVRLSLGKLFTEERDSSTSCSSSEADDLDRITPGTYCVWTPRSKEACKKSNSTGNNNSSSKRWKFRDLLHRSNSADSRKNTFVIFTPLVTKGNQQNREKTATGAGYGLPETEPQKQMNKKSSTKESDRRRHSFLPYKQDLVGLLNNVNGLNRNLQPF